MHVEDHLPENYLRNLLEMLPIPGLYARSTEPDSSRSLAGLRRKTEKKEISQNVDLFKLLHKLNNTRKPTETSL